MRRLNASACVGIYLYCEHTSTYDVQGLARCTEPVSCVLLLPLLRCAGAVLQL
jgi:hypothetical protein